MSAKQPFVVGRVDWQKFLPNPPLLTSFQSGWSNLHVAHHRQPLIELPEICSPQHLITIPLGHQRVDIEFVAEGCLQTVSFQETDYANGCIEILPADLPYQCRSHSTAGVMEMIHCYLEPSFLAQVAYESVNPDRVELRLTSKKADLLIRHMGIALKASLEADGGGSRFYADAMATSLSVHLLRHYATRNHPLRDYEDGLSKQKLRQAIDYMQAHLGENLSLNDIANELGMSQYYFCHLFKQSTGISPHQYLIRQRIEWAKQLLKQPERTVTSIALECGFANQSHFAKCFRHYIGLNPNQFRKS